LSILFLISILLNQCSSLKSSFFVSLVNSCPRRRASMHLSKNWLWSNVSFYQKVSLFSGSIDNQIIWQDELLEESVRVETRQIIQGDIIFVQGWVRIDFLRW
jgi:hypothetical protein